MAHIAQPKSTARETIEAIVLALILTLIIRTFIVQAFKIPSGSMIPTLLIGDHILVNKFAYRFSDPQRGDIMVFQYPKDKEKDFIKRLVGLPGETLEIKDQQVYINNRPLKDKYGKHFKKIDNKAYLPTWDNYGPVVIPQDSYFMMGDNRDNSKDSRFWGFLKRDLIKGKAFMVYFSINFAQESDSFDVGKFFSDLITIPKRIRWDRFGHMLH